MEVRGLGAILTPTPLSRVQLIIILESRGLNRTKHWGLHPLFRPLLRGCLFVEHEQGVDEG